MHRILILYIRLVPFLCHDIWIFYIVAGEGDKAQKRGFKLIIFAIQERLRERRLLKRKPKCKQIYVGCVKDRSKTGS